MFLCQEVSTLLKPCCICCSCISRSSKDHKVVSTYVPTDVKQLKQFLGIANYYHQFVPDYSKIAELFMSYFEKETLTTWSQPVTKHFHNWSTNCWLHHSLCNLHFLLYTDASDFILGVVLCQMQNRGIPFSSNRFWNSSQTPNRWGSVLLYRTIYSS